MKSLAKDTAIYGLSSIIGRFLNYLLTPLYTNYMPTDAYAIQVNMYAYTALAFVVLTFGMETTFFRFANKEGENPDTVFSTSFLTVVALSLAFLALVFGFISPICDILGYADNPEYIEMMASVVAIDAITAIPFCLLRYMKRPVKFVIVRMLNILVSIVLNILCFVVLGMRDVACVFAINLFCSAFIVFLFVPEFLRIKWHFDGELLKRMFAYSWPIFVLGVAGILNQTIDKIIYPLVSPDKMGDLGIYGACVKVANIMALITQTFRYAYEPIVFAKSKDKDSKEYYAVAMKYFLIFTLLAFLCVVGYLDILKYFIGADYRSGLGVVPIVMAAEIMMGIYFNLSFWYKLIDKTIWGAWFSLAGCVVLVLVNVLFIPKYGYIACAWGGFAGYGTAMVLSYIVGQIKNPIDYDMKGMGIYVLITCLFFAIMYMLPSYVQSPVVRIAVNTLLVFAFIAHVVYHDLPLSGLPVVGKYFRK